MDYCYKQNKMKQDALQKALSMFMTLTLLMVSHVFAFKLIILYILNMFAILYSNYNSVKLLGKRSK